jgi:hypothetical protein
MQELALEIRLVVIGRGLSEDREVRVTRMQHCCVEFVAGGRTELDRHYARLVGDAAKTRLRIALGFEALFESPRGDVGR